MVSFKKLFNILAVAYLTVFGVFFFFEFFHGFSLAIGISTFGILGSSVAMVYTVIRAIVAILNGSLILLFLLIATIASVNGTKSKQVKATQTSNVFLLISGILAMLMSIICLIPPEFVTVFHYFDLGGFTNIFYGIAGIFMSFVIVLAAIPAIVLPIISLKLQEPKVVVKTKVVSKPKEE